MFSPKTMYGHSGMIDDDFSTETLTRQHGSLHDFHHLDQFYSKRSASNLGFAVEKEDLEIVDVLPCGFVSPNMDLIEYEHTLLVDNGVGNGVVVDNFLSNEDYLMNGIDTMEMMMEWYQGNTAKKFQEIKTMNLIDLSNESCVTANLDYYQKTKVENIRTMPLAYNLVSKKPLKWSRKNNIGKGQWTIEEDRILIQLVELNGVRKWSDIANKLPGKIGKQCRERWHNHLRPNIKKDVWSDEEDKLLIQAHKEIGNKWAEIAKRLPGRTENSIKNHWNATKRRQYSKRKCRSKYPRGSLLQEYIKSLNLDLNVGQCKENYENTMTTFNALNLEIWKYEQPNNIFNQEILEFDFDEKMFQEECITDLFFDEIPCTPFADHKRLEMDVMELLDFEVNEDLVELTSQTKK